MKGESCKITDKDSSCCSSKIDKTEINSKDHWNNTYSNNLSEKLGWYEEDLSPTLNLIFKTQCDKADRILHVGAGSTTLIND